ncbi:hypothetical protein [Alkaliphilus sp. B6464]|uniref:hypothetical protein n=1 Tax=Alkaliphilus sp. B6464 TaxID=2731219 RepID=UPI001BA6249C|nr:hypothetical protein [Alkaliphilus sp. B6464]QUH22010.1 hypothetical protein HYG84_19080 [Alkaliphilus sp. B6464]
MDDKNKKTENNLQNEQFLNINDITLVSYKNPNRRRYTLIIILILFMALLTTYGFLHIKYISPINTSLKVGNIKVTNNEYDMILEKMENENVDDKIMLTNKYFTDIIILSEKAKELGITVTDEEFRTQNQINDIYNERAALVKKLEKHLEINAEITDEMIEEYYEKTKNVYYVDESNYEYYAFVSDNPFPENMNIEFDKYNKSSGTIKDLLKYGIDQPELNKWYTIDTDDNKYRQIYIVNGNTIYLTLTQVKDSIKDSLFVQKTKGVIQQFLFEGYSKYDIGYYR